MEGSDFIALAGKLAVAAAADEATYRTAISRAYYGAFHIARSFLVELGFQPVGNANVHAFVRHYLAGSGHPEAYLAASELGYLQAARNRADYDLDDSEVGLIGNGVGQIAVRPLRMRSFQSWCAAPRPKRCVNPRQRTCAPRPIRIAMLEASANQTTA